MAKEPVIAAADRLVPKLSLVVLRATRAAREALDLEAIESMAGTGVPEAVMPLLEPALRAFEAWLGPSDPEKAAGPPARAAETVVAQALAAGANAVEVCVPELSKEARQAAVTNYTGDSLPINEALRAGKAVPSGWQQTAADLKRAISESPAAQRMVLTRVVPKDVAEQWKVGTVFQDHGFVSTSKSRDFLTRMVEETGDDPTDWVKVRIDVPKGTGALDVNSVLGRSHYFVWQDEVILAPGHAFEVQHFVGNEMIVKVVKP